MSSVRSRSGRRGCGAVVLLVLALCAGRAEAHQLRLWAGVDEGSMIAGRVYFPGGGVAADIGVRVLGPAGELLGEVRTDDKGTFRYDAKLRCDHQFVADSPDGHRGSFTVHAAELPDDLPSAAGTTAAPVAAEAPVAAPPPPRADIASTTMDEAQLQRIVDQAVNKQVGALRRELQAYADKVRLHDILGGIGYIVGMAGICFYFMGRRRRA